MGDPDVITTDDESYANIFCQAEDEEDDDKDYDESEGGYWEYLDFVSS